MSKEQKLAAVDDFLASALKGQTSIGVSDDALDPGFLVEYPALHQFMCRQTNPDGSPRRPSSLTVFTEDGLFKACLNEKDLGLALYASGDTFPGALLALETRLHAPKVEWRRSAWQKGRGGKKT
jgi:hypothetical protein